MAAAQDSVTVRAARRRVWGYVAIYWITAPYAVTWLLRHAHDVVGPTHRTAPVAGSYVIAGLIVVQVLALTYQTWRSMTAQPITGWLESERFSPKGLGALTLHLSEPLPSAHGNVLPTGRVRPVVAWLAPSGRYLSAAGKRGVWLPSVLTKVQVVAD